MAQKIIAGNWKMNMALTEGLKLIRNIREYVEAHPPQKCKVTIAPPFIHLSEGARVAKHEVLSIAGQNCSREEKGAFTGEVSAEMLVSAGVSQVIIGHSERRQYFYESDEELREKLNHALENKLQPIFCVGENLEDRKSEKHKEKVSRQLRNVVGDWGAGQLRSLIVAYEPVWAIGTGETATPEQAQEMHHFIRQELKETGGEEVASEISLLYGGSLKPANARELFSQPDVDGGLIGGASLKFDSFTQLISQGEEIWG